MQGPDYKKKYMELRSKYMNDLDAAFRLGFEAGGQQAQQQQALDAEAKANEQQHERDMAESNGMPGEEPGAAPEDGSPKEQNSSEGIQSEQNGSELDQHIGKLESMLGQESSPEVQKSLQAIISLRKSEKQAVELKKSQAAIQGIAKALHKPAFKIGIQASHNLNDNAKKSVSMQHKIVTDIMKSWEKEESKAKNSIENILNIEGLIKG